MGLQTVRTQTPRSEMRYICHWQRVPLKRFVPQAQFLMALYIPAQRPHVVFHTALFASYLVPLVPACNSGERLGLNL